MGKHFSKQKSGSIIENLQRAWNMIGIRGITQTTVRETEGI